MYHPFVVKYQVSSTELEAVKGGDVVGFAKWESNTIKSGSPQCLSLPGIYSKNKAEKAVSK